jgi:hypothetical protein
MVAVHASIVSIITGWHPPLETAGFLKALTAGADQLE